MSNTIPVFQLRLPDIDVNVLLEERMKEKLSGDINVAVGNKTIMADVSSTGRADLMLMQNQIDKGASSITWYQSTGSVTLTPAQFKTVVDAVSSYVTSTMEVWQTAVKDIKDKKIKNIRDIDSLPWPSRNF